MSSVVPQSFSTAQTAGTTTTISPTAINPSGLAVGDLMVAQYLGILSGIGFGSGTITPPAGWTQIQNVVNGGLYGVFWKLATSADVSGNSYTFSSNGGDGSHQYRGILNISRISNVDPNNPLVGSAAGVKSGSGNPSIAGFTPTAQPLLMMLVAGTDKNSASGVGISTNTVANSNPTWTQLYNTTASAGDGATLNGATASYDAIATGVFGATVSLSTDSAAVLIAIQPPRQYPSIFGSIFNIRSVIVRHVISGLFGSVFHMIGGTASEITNKWANEAKSAIASWTDDPKT